MARGENQVAPDIMHLPLTYGKKKSFEFSATLPGPTRIYAVEAFQRRKNGRRHREGRKKGRIRCLSSKLGPDSDGGAALHLVGETHRLPSNSVFHVSSAGMHAALHFFRVRFRPRWIEWPRSSLRRVYTLWRSG